MIKNTNLLRILLLTLPVTPLPPLKLSAPLTVTPPPDKADLHSYLLSMKFPIYDKQGKEVPNDFFNNTNRVFQYHDLCMFEIPYGYDSGSVNNGPPVVHEDRYKYFVFHRDSSFGIEYELRYPDRALHLKVDSQRRFVGGFTDIQKNGMFNMQGKPPLLSSQRDEAGGSLLEIYRLLDPKYPADGDTVWLWYSNRFGMLPANLFYIHDKDSLPQMRLVKIHVKVHFHDVPASPGAQDGPDHGEIFWKIEETPYFNRDSAAIYFTRYQTYLDSSRLVGRN